MMEDSSVVACAESEPHPSVCVRLLSLRVLHCEAREHGASGSVIVIEIVIERVILILIPVCHSTLLPVTLCVGARENEDGDQSSVEEMGTAGVFLPCLYLYHAHALILIVV